MRNTQGQARKNQLSTDRPVHHIDSNNIEKEQSPADIASARTFSHTITSKKLQSSSRYT